ncbi:MAG: hypothetical protein H6818_20780 [Phycisphaerales bacterium]|nr:hypothetical protein [Phycisphaerales bacterium]MCB9862226.1 hypothetical protein [Phycisphaerales bacterium]
MMNKRMLGMAILSIGFVGAGMGCSASSAFNVGKNLMKKDSHLVVYVDGMPAEQNKLKKGAMGYAKFKVKGTCSTSPSFKFDFEDPTKFGRITSTNMQIHQAFEADYSHQPEFTIYPATQDSEQLMKPGVVYNLGALPGNMKCMNFEKQPVGGVTLKPGMDYMLVFTVAGDRSESIQVLFSTK